MVAAEDTPVVAYLGPEGSYTHQAALSSFPPQKPPATATTRLAPLATIQDVFTAVQSRSAHRGVVPFENSSNGSVVVTLDLLADVDKKHGDVVVCDEAYVAVRHCLVGRPAARSAATASDDTASCYSHIKRIYSHPQAWGQCHRFLATHLRTVDQIDVSSTSRAAQMAAQDATGASAALSSRVAAELFGLRVLAEGVNDRLGNTTRFLVLRRREPCPSPCPSRRRPLSTAEAEHCKSLVSFTVQHSNPGALANCLTAFSAQGINLTSINTRPSGDRNWHYVFFVELKGASGRNEQQEEEEEEGPVDRALEGLARASSGYRWLGSWKNRLEEEESG